MKLEKEFLSIIEAGKKFKFDEFDLIYLGAFERLPIYTYLSGISVEYEKCIGEDENGQPKFKFNGSKLVLSDYYQLLEWDLKKVYAEKAVNLRIYKLISDVNKINEWILIDPFEPLTIESLSRLYVKDEDVKKLLELDETNEFELTSNSFEKIGRREIQLEIIMAVIDALKYQPLKIPDGGKSQIKSSCLTRPKIFTLSGFDHAWKEGVRNGLFKMENAEKYSSQ